MIKCCKCKVYKDKEEYFTYLLQSHWHICKECFRKLNKKYQKKYYESHPEQREKNKVYLYRWIKLNRDSWNQSQRKNYRRVKNLVLSKYSNGDIHCSVCNSKNNMSIDHIKGNGCNHRESLKFNSSYQFYMWLIKNNFPKGYRVLCKSCNSSIKPIKRRRSGNTSQKIIKIITRDKVSRAKDILNELESVNLTKHSIGRALYDLCKKNDILRISKGFYKLNSYGF